jgi:hypothetical protein
MVHRRGLIKAAVLAFGAWPLVRLTAPARAAGRARPRFYLQIVADGGMDAVFTTDAKSAGDVDTGIDIPYPAKDIVESNGARLGPPFRALAQWMPRLAIVNAFRQNSANHVGGMLHTLRCNSRANLDGPTLLDILGTRRGDEAAGSINIGATQPTAFSPHYFGAPSTLIFGNNEGFFQHLDRAAPEDLMTLARVLKREAASAGKDRSRVQRTTASNLLEAAAFFERVATVPRFKPPSWSIPDDQGAWVDLERAVWLFENRLARCVTVTLGHQAFDTHYSNTALQTGPLRALATMLDRLFTELDQRMVDGTPLASQIAIIIGSEIGRFPRLNHGLGKDHFPQAPYLFFGPAFVAGASYGATGRDMAAVPVSLKTGRPERGGHLLRVDDIGSTLLTLDGVNPELHGYTGENLAFLTG